MVVCGVIRDDKLACLVGSVDLLNRCAGRHVSYRVFVGARVDSFYIAAFAAEVHAFQHAFAFERCNDLWRDSLRLEVKVESDSIVASNTKSVFEAWDPHNPETWTHPGPSIQQS